MKGDGVDQLRDQMAQTLGADHVLAGDACQRYTIDGVTPALVAKPGDVEGVSRALTLASRSKATVVPWGGGTRMALGYPPRGVDLVLSVERLQRILAYDAADLTVTLEAGCTLDQASQALATRGQMLPLDPPWPTRATIGGTLATGQTGLRRSLYGGPRDLLLGVRAVDALGVITRAGGRVVKNVTGYDMNKLYLGSLGTLGVVVEASFKLVPVPEHEETVVGVCAAPARALAVAERWVALPVRPASVCAVTAAGLPALALRGTAAEDVLVAARFAGPPAAVQRAVREARALAHDMGGDQTTPFEGPAHTDIWAAMASLPSTAHLAHDEALLKVSVLPSELATVLETATTVAGEHGLRLTWLADAGAGVLFLQVRTTDEPTLNVEAASAALGPGLRALQGMLAHRWRNAVVHGCPPALKADLPLWGADPPGIDVMRAIKRQFDPAGTLNPGRFVGGL